jgi:MFS family permease
MVLLAPLGDRIENRRLISTLLAITAAGLVAVGVAPDFPLLLAAALAVGATYGTKRGSGWCGYKTHLSETCEPHAPQFQARSFRSRSS